ncbi:GNAT family N-acetyltransferase [Bosea caraganae]|nr:GNAT family N-acetyltransferase [Bosea caraganae]
MRNGILDGDERLRSMLANCRQYWLNYGYELSRDGDITLYSTGVRHPQLNGVMAIEGQDMDALIGEARQRLAGHPSVWWIGPDSRGGAADAILSNGGIRRATMPVYAVDLADLPDLVLPAGVTIEEVSGEAGVADWTACFAPSMGVPTEEIEKMTRVEIARRDEPGKFVRFAAKIDGKTVGTSALLDSHGVAGIYLCSTLDGYRRRGICTALTLRAAATGLERGLRTGTLQASPMGEPVYRKLGFQKAAEYSGFVF